MPMFPLNCGSKTETEFRKKDSGKEKDVIKKSDLDLVTDEVWEELATMVTPPHSHDDARVRDEL